MASMSELAAPPRTARDLRLRDPRKVATQPLLTALVLLLSDVAALALALTLAVYVRLAWGGQYEPVAFLLRTYPAILLFLGTFAALRLYAPAAPSPVEEIRRITTACFLVFLGLGAITYLSGSGDAFSRGVYLLALGFACVLVPLYRMAARFRFGRRSWWGYPVAVFGAGTAAERVVQALLRQPGLGLRPVAVLDDAQAGGELAGVPILPVAEAPILARERRVPYAILALDGLDGTRLRALSEGPAEAFARLLIVPDLDGIGSLWVETKEVGGLLGLEVQRSLLMAGPRRLKRAIDLVGVLLGGLLILPFIALIILAIRLTSPGPAFYGQMRLGADGRPFKAWKFRSMVRNADAILQQVLAADPARQAEWDATQKLRRDPRVTLVGRFLRKTSLDELPQLWNVLRGEMSLVGPRPIVAAEIPRYGAAWALYQRVRPGMTGLWQVSGRSDTGYGERVQLDTYYVRNWSVWIDAWIIARTIRVVLLGSGAY
jgi:Undecaprenyl-phosphate galactose phosphotransferase WbaP